MWLLLRTFRAFSTQNEARLRLGRSIRNIPLDYLNFFTRPAPEVIDLAPYDPLDFQLVLHADQLLEAAGSGSLLPEGSSSVFTIHGVAGLAHFCRRTRWLVRWGHYFWRLPDSRALNVAVTRLVVHPPGLVAANADLPERVIMRVYWSLQSLEPVREVMGFGDLLQVQAERAKRAIGVSRPPASPNPPQVLYSGISRYVFEGSSGLCKELHIERLEPPLSCKQARKQQNWLLELARQAAGRAQQQPALNSIKR
jgi:hypothetical protein